ncbi:hypothetical protein BDW75DRAFT_245422 [Aspergillus navahoensis]
MGSISNAIPVKLDWVMGKNSIDTPPDTIIETIWAITHFVYTGDNEVNFPRYTVAPIKNVDHPACRSPLSSIRSYQVDQNAKPAEIAKRGYRILDDSLRHSKLDGNSCFSSFTDFIRQAGLLIVAHDGRSRLEQSSEDYHNSIIFHVSLQEEIPTGTLISTTSKHEEYLADLADTIERVSQLITQGWHSPLREMNFLGPRNWSQILKTSPFTAKIGDSVMSDILLEQSRTRPGKIAVQAWDGNFTYGELFDLSRQMAALLLQSGVSPEERIGFCMKKSRWAVVTIWGILMAGCAAVPLDIRNPPKRTGELLKSVNARYVVADQWTAPALEDLEVGILRCQASILEHIDASEQTICWQRISPSSVGVILFTSGSTGLPKGVIIEHGPLYASIEKIADEFGIDETSKTFQFAPYVFDGSMGDLFCTMLRGACLIVPSEEERLDNLTGALATSEATHVCLTSTVMSQVRPADLPDLRYMIAVGELLSKENFLRWSPHVHILSAYGIVESIVYDSFAHLQHLASDNRNIGQANGPCLWVTDQDDPEKVKPIGAIGEILIEGPLLARGYMGDPKRTAERFISAPSWLKEFRSHEGDSDGLRCYRSGDYGMRNADGSVLYLGRADTQVKIRGQRVELGEIEHSLLVAEPAFDKVAVEVIRIPRLGNTQTVVAFVARPGSSKSLPLLPVDDESRSLFRRAQAQIQQSLPRHMVPSIFIPVRAIPQGGTAKRDRKTLHLWAESLTEEQVAEYQLRDASPYCAPETSDQVFLHRIWSKVLGIYGMSLGADDNFFKVGGDSIKAIELVSELRDHGRVLTVSKIFQSPELRTMAESLGHLETEGAVEIPMPFELIVSSGSPQKEVEKVAQLCRVSVDDVEDIYPTAPMQEALMAISARRANVYTHRVVFKVPPTLDIDRFKRAWDTLISEQPIFRTRIITLPGASTVQVVLRHQDNWYTGSSLRAFVQYDESTPFDYGSALCRYSLVTDDHHGLCFVWSGHHAISDGWSRPAMFKELHHIYHNGFSHRQTPYTLFIRHTSQLDLSETEDFWIEQFPDTVESFPRLPNPDYVPNAGKTKSCQIQLDRQSTSSITTATLVQAAWALVTATYANTDEPVFGLTLSGRDAPVPEITRIMGITIATVAVRVVIDNTVSVAEYLEDVQQYISQVKQHQHVGLQRIARLSPEARSAASFQNLLVIQPADEADDHAMLVKMGFELVQREDNDKLDHVLTVQCTIDGEHGGLQVKAHYDDQVISDQEMESMLHLLDHLTKQLATESATVSLHNLDRISPHDLTRLATWNARMPPAIEKTLHGLFQEQVRLKSRALALDGFGGQMTYADLDHTSSQLARYLVQRGAIDVESRVVLSFAKSQLPIITMLAVLKSGGVCVSINREHPLARQVDLTRDIGATVVLCDEEDVDRFKSNDIPAIGITHSLLSEIQSRIGQPPLPIVLPQNAAFIVHTSGSTGKPKGSVLEHQSLATHLTSVGELIGINAHFRTIQFSAYTFDVHILEIMGTLVHGGCVCVISDHERMNNLPGVINERQVNFAVLTKTVSRLLEPEKVPTLKTLILTGEPNGRQDYWRWAKHLRLFNGLGPSECTPLVCLTRHPVHPDDDPANVGHAMGCHLWVTDHRRPDRLVPLGCVGELTVEGPIVGRGYVNRPRENAAAFVIDPAWSLSGSGHTRRFYRSGDLARMNQNGSITFLGRKDSQIKIHGQRVELGEIEDHLRHCSSSFAASAVEIVKVSSRGGASALVVFCSAMGHEPDPAESDKPILPMNEGTRTAFSVAQVELGKKLPQYMVPSIFIPVRRLPLNASGKLERRTLRDWFTGLDANDLGQYYLSSPTESRVPETVQERRLQALWAKVLNVPPNTIHVEDHFFRMGGDSVLSMKLTADAREEGISMTVADIFRTPVLQDMALTMSAREPISSQPAHGRLTVVKPMSLIKNQALVDSCMQDAARDCGVDPALITDIYPCNPVQEALMAVSSHQTTAYSYQVVLKLPPSMDVDRFKATWDMLVSRQAIFRTRIVFHRLLGSLQVVLRSPVHWNMLTGIALEEHMRQAGAMLVEYGSELCRFDLIQDGGTYIFVGTLHHSLYDGWSLMQTYAEFNSLYEGGESQSPITPYTNFIQHLSRVENQHSDEFWRGQFPRIIKSYPQLPVGYTSPRAEHSQRSSFSIDPKSGRGVTLPTVVQATWALLMSHYSDSRDVVFGLILSGRDAPVDGITSIIGPTIATVPLHVEVDPHMSVASLLEGLQRKTTDMKKYQHAGLQSIRRLSPEAKAAVDFQNLMIVHTMADDEITSPLSALGLETIKSNAEEFLDLALTIECTVRPGKLDFCITYDENVVAGGQVKFMLHQLGYLTPILLEVSTNLQLKDIALVSPYDLEHLTAWNRTSLEPSRETLHSLVENQAQKTPDTIAVSGFDADYTYQELDLAANQLAAYLNSMGVGPEDRVILCFRKGILPIIAMLAVLKSGGVCVSVNFDHPQSRRLDICHETEAVAVLCDVDVATQFASYVPEVVVVDSKLTATLRDTPLTKWVRPVVQPDHAAFIMYTSGSTGKPKGCILEHHSVCHSLQIYVSTTGVTPPPRTLQFASYSFDVHVLEIFGTLIAGGCVCVISDDERVNDLAAAIHARQATRLLLTPTVAQLINPDDVPDVDTLIMGGEPLSQNVLEMWSRVRLIQQYAPAETSNLACVNLELGLKSDPSNIGRPYGCQVWITERSNPDRLCPVGCIGELLVEGSVLGREYLKRPDATEAAFIENPRWARTCLEQDQQGTRRFYRTGDMAYYQHDGTIKFVGRADTQVKIHGQRVELQEIERQIVQRLDQGSEVVVDVVSLMNALTLTAFLKLPVFVGEGDEDLAVDETAHLEQFQQVVTSLEQSLPVRLPQYMVPSVFIPVARLPTSASAKIDRKRLKQFATSLTREDIFTSGSNAVKRPPATKTEAALQRIWAQILNQTPDEIGIQDTFMALGGDSITAMQVVSECRKLGISLRVSTILEKKTIQAIAPHCTTHLQNTEIMSNAADNVLFGLAPIQKLYFEQEDQTWTHFHQEFLCRLKKGVSTQDVHRAFDSIVERHAMLRARFRRAADGAGWMQYTVPSTPESYRFMSHEPYQGTASDIAPEVTSKMLQSRRCIDIVTGPIFSVDFLPVASEDSMLYMVAHHLVVDLVSWRVIWRDLEEILKNESLSPSASSTVAFQDWVSLQQHRRQDLHLSAGAAYPFYIPHSQYHFWNVPSKDNVLGNTTIESFSLTPATTALLLGEANHALRTKPLDLISGLLVHSFHQVFRDRPLPSIFIEHHGRELWEGLDNLDLSQTVGWFSTTYPVHVPITLSTTPSDAVRLVKDTRSRIPGNGQPYFALSHLSPNGSPFAGHTPAEILLNYAGLFQQLEANDSVIELESRITVPKAESDPKTHRFAMIDVEIDISHGVAQFSFRFHKQMAHAERLRLASTKPVLTLSDVPHLPVQYNELQELLSSKLTHLSPEDIEDIFPCTAMQEGILLSQQRDDQVYQGHHIWEFSDHPLLPDNLPARIAEAWNTIVHRHDSLRSGIIDYASASTHALQVVLRKLPKSRYIEVQELIKDVAEIPKRPEPREDSLFWTNVPRLTVYRLENQRVACDLKISNILIDGTSLDLFMTELIHFLTGVATLPPSLPFVKYMEYERRVPVEQKLAYWAGYLQDVVPCHVPTASGLNPTGEYAYIKLPHEIMQGLQLLCQRWGVTQAALIQTAWAIVLGAFTSQDDVCFGYLASDRDAPLDGIGHSIGLFISMQVCRVRVKGVVKDIVQDVHRDTASGLEHRNCSLAQIQNVLGVKGAALFNTCVTIRRALDEPTADKMTSLVSPLESAEKTEFAIALDASVGGTGAQLGLSYRKGPIHPELAYSIAGSLEAIICGFTSAGSQPVLDIPLIGSQQQRQMQQWNSIVPEKVHVTLHGLVEKQARATPHAIATSGFDGEYTYAQLDTAADQLAAHLVAIGVRPEVRVALCFSKSTWAIIAMLAILKSGGACVSLNPENPIARLRDICDDAGVAVLICDTKNATPFQGHIRHVVNVDEELFARLDDATNWIAPSVEPSNAAFVVYTSGSTGKPKGCTLEHHMVAKSQLTNAKAMGIGASSRVLQFAAYTFDVSLLEIFASLVMGACVCVISDEQRMNDLAGAINKTSADLITLTPTVATLLSPAAVPTVKTLVLGGEALTQKALDIWSGHVKLVNYWGPSECSNSGCLNNTITQNTDPMNIGHASGCSIWIVDLNNPHRLAPVGCVGELVIEGPMLGRGYINRPDLSAAAFVINLAWSQDGSGRSRRFYRTGDLARFNWDGSVVFVGRKDAQVKVHGQRVELGDVEYQIRRNLNSRGKVSDAVAETIRPQGSPHRILVAYLLTSSGDQASDAEEFAQFVQDLNARLGEWLPAYMVPSAYIPLKEIPLTATSKTDRKRLRQMGETMTMEQLAARQPSQARKRAPGTAMELRLQRLWASILGIDAGNIGADDNFLQIGGDSIGAMRLVRAAHDDGLSLTVADVFRLPRLSQLALSLKVIKNTIKGEAGNPRPFSLVPSPLPLNSLISGLQDLYPVTHFQSQCIEAAISQPLGRCLFLSIDLPSNTSIPRLISSCVQTWQHIDILRTIFMQSADGTEYLQALIQDLPPTIDVHETNTDLAKFNQTIYDGDSQTRLQIGQSFTRFIITHTPDNQARVTLRVSHAQYDGLTKSTFFSTLLSFYFKQKPPSIPPFARYMRHLTKHQSTGQVYWRDLLQGSQMTQVPSDISIRAPNTHAKNYIHTQQIPAPPTPHGYTPATLFTAVCACVLGKLTHSTDVVFGTLVSGRATLPPSLQDTVGPCINYIPTRVQLPYDMSSANNNLSLTSNLESALATIKTQHLASLPHEITQFPFIAKNCTSWPKTITHYGIVLEFQNIDETPEVSLSGLKCPVEAHIPSSDALDSSVIGIIATPVRGMWEVRVLANPECYSEMAAKGLLEEIIRLLESLHR